MSSTEWLSASAVGEYVYCARAYGLTRVIATADDPAAAALAAQGLSLQAYRGATTALRQRQAAQTRRLNNGANAHGWHGRLVRLTSGLMVAGLGLILLAITIAAWG